MKTLSNMKVRKTNDIDDDMKLSEALHETFHEPLQEWSAKFKTISKKDKTKIIFFIVWAAVMFILFSLGILFANLGIKIGFIFMIVGGGGWFVMIVFLIVISKVKGN